MRLIQKGTKKCDFFWSLFFYEPYLVYTSKKWRKTVLNSLETLNKLLANENVDVDKTVLTEASYKQICSEARRLKSLNPTGTMQFSSLRDARFLLTSAKNSQIFFIIHNLLAERNVNTQTAVNLLKNTGKLIGEFNFTNKRLELPKPENNIDDHAKSALIISRYLSVFTAAKVTNVESSLNIISPQFAHALNKQSDRYEREILDFTNNTHCPEIRFKMTVIITLIHHIRDTTSNEDFAFEIDSLTPRSLTDLSFQIFSYHQTQLISDMLVLLTNSEYHNE